LYTWVDVGRKSRDGLHNTNDFTEALLIAVLIETVIPWYENVIETEKQMVCSIKTLITLAGKLERAFVIKNDYGNDIRIVHDGTDLRAIVPSSSGRVLAYYNVSLTSNTCTCKDFLWSGQKCKHILAAFLWFSENFSTVFSSEIQQVTANTQAKPVLLKDLIDRKETNCEGS